jgi:hypothetical protein
VISEGSNRDDYQAMLAEKAAERQNDNPTWRESAITACEELTVLLWGVVEGNPIPVSDYQSWLSKTRHACPLIALTLRFAALANEREWLLEFATAVEREAPRKGEYTVPEGTLWAWDLMITDVRWRELVDQVEIPIFQILHKVAQSLQEFFPDEFPKDLSPKVGLFSRALETNERVPLLGALETLNSEPWCSHLAMSAYVAIAEHAGATEQNELIDRVEHCFRERNFWGSFGFYITRNSPMWPLLVRLGCSRGFCHTGS